MRSAGMRCWSWHVIQLSCVYMPVADFALALQISLEMWLPSMSKGGSVCCSSTVSPCCLFRLPDCYWWGPLCLYAESVQLGRLRLLYERVTVVLQLHFKMITSRWDVVVSQPEYACAACFGEHRAHRANSADVGICSTDRPTVQLGTAFLTEKLPCCLVSRLLLAVAATMSLRSSQQA